MKTIHRWKRKLLYYITKKDLVFYKESGVLDPDLYETCFQIGDMSLYYVDKSLTKNGISYYYSSYTNLIEDA